MIPGAGLLLAAALFAPTDDPGVVDASAPADVSTPADAPEAGDTPEPGDTLDPAAPTEGTDPSAPEAEDVAVSTPRPEPEPDPDSGAVFHVSEGSGAEGPPYYTEADQAELRQRHELEPNPPQDRRRARWRCLIADPTCGISFELDATAAYAYRMRQGDVSQSNDVRRWHSGRAQYDFWLNIPVLVESRGDARYSRITLGPKGGVILSDTGDLWGNVGIATRYWLGRGRWAPTIEFTSALSFKLGGRPTKNLLPGEEAKFRMQHGPVGFVADVGFGLGGFGAIVVGGQYDSPLAREDVPERFRTSAAGMFFVGFRGNILWGGPAAAAVLTHGLAQRFVEQPN